MRSFMFKTRLNEKLSYGGEFETTSLDNEESKKIFFDNGEYKQLENSDPIDGYCFKNGNLFLFQITVAQICPVEEKDLH